MNEELKAKTLAVVSQQMANWVVDNPASDLDQPRATWSRLWTSCRRALPATTRRSTKTRSRPPWATSRSAAPRLGPGSTHSKRRSSRSTPARTCPKCSHTSSTRPPATSIARPSSSSRARTPSAGTPRESKLPTRHQTAQRSAQRRHPPQGRLLQPGPGPGHPWRAHRARPQVIGRLGGSASGTLAVPLILREKIAAILYCDTTQDEVPTAEAEPRRGARSIRGQDDRPALAGAEERRFQSRTETCRPSSAAPSSAAPSSAAPSSAAPSSAAPSSAAPSSAAATCR